jgi:hypothetical protein
MTIQVDSQGTAKVVPNKERLRLWADALRSGEYEQAQFALREPLGFFDDEPQRYGYCCLGVACEVAFRNGLVMDVDVYESGDDHDAYSVMPKEVAEWFGIYENVDGTNRREFNPYLVDREEVNSVDPDADLGLPPVWASELNDDYAWTFNQIADAVDKKWKLRDTSV